MTVRAVNATIYDKFYVGTTGLTILDFIYGFELDGISEAITPTITEDALGWYEIEFIPTNAGDLTLKLTYSDFFYYSDWVIDTAASSEYQTGSNIYFRFYIGTTGLSGGDFTYLLEKDNASTAVTLTIAEDSGGWYDAFFNPTSFGDWIARLDYGDLHFKLSAFVNQAGSGGGTTINLNASSLNTVSANSSSVGVTVLNSNITVTRQTS